MNRITVTHAEIIKIQSTETPKDTVVTLFLRDVIGTHPICFQATFHGHAAITVTQALTVGDCIDISGSIWVKHCRTANNEANVVAIIENPANLYKLSLHTRIDLSDHADDPPGWLFPEDDGEETIPF